jgi:lipopolysaccharide/colanic/teichoic acid biosynthesis glycosyltransferase
LSGAMGQSSGVDVGRPANPIPSDVGTDRAELNSGAVFSGQPSFRVLPGLQPAIKRLMDVVVAGIALLLFSPLFLAIAIAIKLTSPGPVFYRQRRLMQGGAVFMMYKFRTMVDGAEAMLDQVAQLNQASGPLFKSRNDPRVTAAGRFLRMHYLDELPQLINVLLGHMSLVGPRPCLPEEAARHPEILAFRFTVPQGMTGPWQTNGHHGITFEEQVRVERRYADDWSLACDLQILIRTVPLVFLRTGF